MAKSSSKYKPTSGFSAQYGSPLEFIVGPQVRVLLGIILVICCGVWLFQNRGIAREEAKKLSGSNVDAVELAESKNISSAKVTQRDFAATQEAEKSLELGGSAPKETAMLGTWNAGAAGAILLISGLFRGKFMGLLLILGGIFAVFGTKFAPTMSQYAILGIGVGVQLVAMLFLREKID